MHLNQHSWREIFTYDLNSILFHGLSRKYFPISFKKAVFLKSSQPKGIFPCDTLLEDETFLWGTEIKVQMTCSCEKDTEIDP